MENKIALAYIRVSSEGQEENTSLESQRNSIRAYAMANGFNIEETYADIDSGANEARTGLMALRERIRHKHFHAVIVAKIDRFTRDLLLGETTRKEIEKYEGTLISVSEHIDTSTPSGLLFAQLLQAFAQFDKASIVYKMNQGKKNTIESKGTFGGGTLGYGYRPNGNVGEAAINETEAEAIRLIFKLHKENLSTYKISTILTEKGYKARNGKDFYPVLVHRILKRHSVYESVKPINFNFKLKEGIKAKQPRII